jgi:hypothetical protein
VTNRFACAILGITAFFLVFAPLAAAQDEHPDLKDGKVKVGSVLVLPPKVDVEKTGVKSTDPEMEKAHEIEDLMSTNIVNAMNARGCKAVAGPSTDDGPSGDNNMKYTLADLQTQFDQLDQRIRKKQKDVRTGRFSMGDAVNKLNPDGSTDALVFTRAIDREVTGGKLTVSLLIGGPLPAFFLEMAVVDARTGNVLYYGKRGTMNETDGSTTSVQKLLKDFGCFAGGTPQADK